jgi:hypothetical protein
MQIGHGESVLMWRGDLFLLFTSRFETLYHAIHETRLVLPWLFSDEELYCFSRILWINYLFIDIISRIQ